jgi:hypothetical protein
MKTIKQKALDKSIKNHAITTVNIKGLKEIKKHNKTVTK